MSPRDPETLGWTVEEWLAGYQERKISTEALRELVAGLDRSDPAWIHVASEEQLSGALRDLEERLAAVGGRRDELPLYGVPFAVKDNIDVAGWPTTAACPAFSYVADASATVVARLIERGAIVVGKTNLDQFATGLVGTRSPYGTVASVFDRTRIGGGSSSGSASVVTRGLVPFALGTDTAGSGRVPAAMQNIVGFKPTRGWFSARGVVPACRTLDCVSIFALTVDDAEVVASVAAGFDPADPFARRYVPEARSLSGPLTLGVPESPEFFGDRLAERAFEEALARFEKLGANVVPIEFTPFRELAGLLYQGPWVAERTIIVEELLRERPENVHPVVRGIVEGGARFAAMDAFRAEYRRATLAREIARVLAPLDALVVPTTPTVYSIEEVEREPVSTNSRLGTYTNFANLADLCAWALPSGFREDGFPAGITLLAPAFSDARLGAIARLWEADAALPLGALGRRRATSPAPSKLPTVDEFRLFVVGAHLRGFPLNRQLLELGATFERGARTAPKYRLHLLPNTVPEKPGLLRVGTGGAPIAGEVWRLGAEAFGRFVAGIPAPLGIGSVELEDGGAVSGFLCEAFALEGAPDITAFGGFASFVSSRNSPKGPPP